MQASVVIPTYHRPQLLVEAVSSVIAQTASASQIIVVSADPAERLSIEKMLKAQVGSGPWEVISGGEKLTGGAARNLGWCHSSSEIVFFLDDDDTFLTEKLSKHLERHRKGASVVYSEPWLVYGVRKVRARYKFVPSVTAFNLTDEGVCPASTSCVSVTRSALATVNGFDNVLQSYQDFDLWYRLAIGGAQFDCVQEPLTNFIQHEAERVSLNFSRRSQAAKVLLNKYANDIRLSRFLKQDLETVIARRALLQAEAGNLYAIRTFISGLVDGRTPVMRKNTLMYLARIFRAFGRQ